jgi:hypothetical protein
MLHLRACAEAINLASISRMLSLHPPRKLAGVILDTRLQNGYFVAGALSKIVLQRLAGPVK